MAEVVMPRLSDSMEEGTILQWLKKVGEEVAVGEELVEIETDKANMAYESDLAGTLTEILAEEGATLPIGTPIARIGDSGEGSGAPAAGPATEGEGSAGGGTASVLDPSPSAPPAGEASGTAAEAPSGAINAPAEAPSGPQAGDGSAGRAGERVKASPLAKRMAKEGGLDLSELAGSGPGGRILKVDVERAASKPAALPAGAADVGGPRTETSPPAGPPTAAAGPAGQSTTVETAKGTVTIEEPSKLQATVSRRMAESKATAPHFYLEAEIDMSRAVEARGKVKEIAAPDLIVPSFNDMVVKASALALREHPRANGAYRDGRFEIYSRVNVGIAVAAREALVVPTLFDADRKGLWQIGTEARELSQRVRDGAITPPELSGATFTVSNLGMYGIDSFAAVINPPQAAILAVGAIRERPVVRDGEAGTAHLMRVNLACDHRILYGAEGAEFLARIRELLEEPFSLAL
jgi:pyruvate dehydrogenase E2 component (dihydrolipoamide acetyltransferase)